MYISIYMCVCVNIYIYIYMCRVWLTHRLAGNRITAGPELEMLAAWLATNPALTDLE